MKQIITIWAMISFVFLQAQVTISPNPFQVTESITITIDENTTSTDCNGFSNPTSIYMHSGIGDDSNPWGYSVVGNWGADDGVGEMTDNGDGTWSITITPATYYGLTSAQQTTATKMGMVFRSQDGTQEFKDNGCSDFIIDVGYFQASLTNPTETTTVLNSGDNLTISATNTNGNASYTLKANGAVINTNAATTNYNYTHSNITSNQNYKLDVVQGANMVSFSFEVVIDPATVSEAMPSGLENGINYNSSDATKATLVLDAPNKDFVYVAGSFNNWQPDSSYAMKKDPSSSKFWLELTGFTSGQIETYQYWVYDENPVANSPNLVKTADPYSTLVLSPFDDPGIPASTYPNLPTYPAGQEREVTVLQTGQTPYNWQITNFNRPKKEDLIIYEVLIRDFDADRNYQDLIDKMDYFKNLNINAIELMPVMEYEGNESWGYNTAFHMALDKFYGTENKLKEFIDLCHQNDIAVILDLAINHAYGRSPLVRMWMDDPDGDGWGGPSSDSPYFNQVAKHSYSVGSDFNHEQPKTQYYTERVIKHWVEDFKIDGIRWDLTKGFTQSCTASNDGCTNSYQQDRVDRLKAYADYTWSLDPDQYIIFEHLGTDAEEQQWANHRVGEGKGIMLWGKLNYEYNELTMGWPTSGVNIARMGHESRGFTEPRLVGYAESHDEERLMYKNVQYGNSSGGYNVQDLNTALDRMSALGAASVLIPGPKMIWHFGDLGMDNSIFTCSNGTVDTNNCKLSTKPQPQWTESWLTDAIRSQIYNDWAIMHELKTTQDVFEGDYSISNYSDVLKPRIYIWDDTIPSTELKNVVILCNFDVTTQNIPADFPYTGTWYDLMDNSTTINVSNTAMTINIAPGQFRIFGNQTSTLSTQELEEMVKDRLVAYPNPVKESFRLSRAAQTVQVYSLNGQLAKEFKGDFAKDAEFNISELPKNVYMLRVFDSNNKTYTTKLIKQ